MIRCYKCGKELNEVKEIGEIIRSYDGEDFCFCKECTEELHAMDEADANLDVQVKRSFKISGVFGIKVREDCTCGKEKKDGSRKEDTCECTG